MTQEQIKEMAADLLHCSMDKIRLRFRVLLEGDRLKERDGIVYFVPAFNNGLKSDGTREYKNQKFNLFGSGVWFQDNQPFFCTSCSDFAVQMIYVECCRV